MKRTFSFLILTATLLLCRAEQQPFDSIMNIMKDSSIPLIERYYMTGEIDNFPYAQQIEILKSLIPEAKVYEDKAVITRLYSVISNTYIWKDEMGNARTYLDSAFIYKGKFENNAIAGLMHFTAGHYYHTMNDTKTAHKNYYQSIEYLKKLPALPPLLTDLYHNLATIYSLWEDEKNLKELVQEMKEVPVYLPHQSMLNKWVMAEYFNVQFRKNGQVALLDSAIKYNELAIQEFATEEIPFATGYQLAQNYISLVKAYIQKGDAATAQRYLVKAEQLTNKDKWVTLMQLHTIKGEFYVFNKEYDLAEEELNKAIKLLNVLKEEEKTDYFYFYIDIYDHLGLINEKKNLFKEALAYEKKALEYRKRLFDKENATIVNDLRAQYNLEQKERIVSQLTLLNERRKNINILAGIIIWLFIAVVVQLVIRARVKKRENENKFKIEQMRIEQGRMQSYLEGLEISRERLAKELHDNISNELLALRMKITQSADLNGVKEELERIQAEVRAVSHDLTPPVFQHATFTEVLCDYVHQWNKLSNVHLSISFTPANDNWDHLPEDVSLNLYRIIQEAAGNALKYAQATTITISLLHNENNILLTIQDNGKGFDTQRQHKGIGLKLIQERAKSLNGEVSIHSVPGNTCVEVVIPQ